MRARNLTPPGRSGIGVLALAATVCCTSLTGCALLPGRAERARNVVLLIGDGLGISAYTATRLWKAGATGRLAIDALPHTALCSTYSYDHMVTDSAAAVTAIFTGTKTRQQVLGEGPDAVPGDATDPRSGREGVPITTIAELAAWHGRAIGIVTTARVTDATPAAAYAHVRHRDREYDIAAQLVAPCCGTPAPDVILGGGRHYFLPAREPDPEYPDRLGGRTDGRNLIAELIERGYAYAWNRAQFAGIDPATAARVLALFEPLDMRFEVDRANDSAGEPSLAELTEVAIRILSRRPGGYFLLVEGGRIDHALHVNNVAASLADAAMFDEAVARAAQLTSAADTLLIVTADHSHGLTINGYPVIGRGEGASGDEDLAATRASLLGAGGVDDAGQPYPVLSFANGPGGFDPPPVEADRPAAIARSLSTHSGDDVFVAARGPGAERIHGFLTNTDLFDVMRRACGF